MARIAHRKRSQIAKIQCSEYLVPVISCRIDTDDQNLENDQQRQDNLQAEVARLEPDVQNYLQRKNQERQVSRALHLC